MPLEKEILKPMKIKCLRCKEDIVVKYVRSSKNYSNKNNWGHWTDDEKNKQSYLCDDCLIELYYSYKKEFHQLVTDKRKQNVLRQYINAGTIKRKAKKTFFS